VSNGGSQRGENQQWQPPSRPGSTDQNLKNNFSKCENNILSERKMCTCVACSAIPEEAVPQQ